VTRGRLLSQAELEDLARPPATQLARALDDGDADVVSEVYARLEGAFRTNLHSWRLWEEGTTSFLAVMPDTDGEGVPDVGAERMWLIGAVHGVQPADPIVVRQRHGEEIRQLAARDRDACLGRYDEIEASFRRLHDAHRDWTSWLWSCVYRRGGPDALEACLRAVGGDSMMRWMARDLSESPVDRVREWSAVMLANLSTITVEELDDRFRIVQDPCGTCTRQLQSGCYAPPLDLAVVAEPHAITYGRGDMPVYRAHVAVMHELMPIERIGVRWPLVTCPATMGTGPCVIELLKDPRQSSISV
jgi:hypothetical protein